MSKLQFKEIEQLVVYGFTAWNTFKRIHYTLIQKAISKGFKFLNFSPNGTTYKFSSTQPPNGISIGLKGLKKKTEVRDALITQINYIVDEYNNICTDCK
jgi:hypothetical protein